MARRGAVMLAIGGGLLLVVVFATFLLLDTPSTRDQVCDEYGADIDALVFIQSSLTTEDLDGVEARLEATEGVQSAELLSPEATWSSFQSIVAGTDLESSEMPPNFPASVEVAFDEQAWDDLDRVSKALLDDSFGSSGLFARTGPGEPFDQVPVGSWHDTDIVVFMEPGVPDDDIESVRGILDEHPAVAGVDYLDQEAALEEFSELFADSPELVATVSPEILPSSFRVTMIDSGDQSQVEQVEESVERRDGVREVVRSPAVRVFGVPGMADALTGC